ncbi:MAG: phosphatase PAP2 family protein [Clostridia bacterium]|nr:phosphatase PAP2 family protein [Clostridia bacterium]
MTFMHKLAEGCMPFLYFLESIRNPVLDFLFALITHLGEETFFLAIAILFFWCINKREGYFILITGLIGTVVNQLAKLFFRIPRPWVLDKNFDIIESARAEATGYSFPSGHTQNIAGTYGAIAAYNPKKWKTVLCVTIIVLVAFSRMYLGVHTPLDVVVSLLVALGLVVALRPCFATEEGFKKSMPFIVIGSVILSIGFLVYVLSIAGDTTLDPDNFNSGMKNACTLLGCTAGLVLVYFVDTKFVNFTTEGRWYVQIIKLAIGLGGVLAIKSGLSKPLVSLFGDEYIARAVRYFLIVGFAGAVWPLTFAWFGKLRIGFMERFTDWVSGHVAKLKKSK